MRHKGLIEWSEYYYEETCILCGAKRHAIRKPLNAHWGLPSKWKLGGKKQKYCPAVATSEEAMNEQVNEKLAKFMGCSRDLRACYKGRDPQRGYELCDDPSCLAKEHFFVWRWPDGSHARFTPGFLNPTYGIAHCFKWLEPPLYERFGIYHIGFARVVGVGYNCFMNRKAIEWPYREEGRSKELTTLGHGESLGAAFCDAAWKVINKYPELASPSPGPIQKGGL